MPNSQKFSQMNRMWGYKIEVIIARTSEHAVIIIENDTEMSLNYIFINFTNMEIHQICIKFS